LFTKEHCEKLCEGRKCSAKCRIRCGEGGQVECAPVRCREVSPRNCSAAPSTVPTTTSTEATGTGQPTCQPGWLQVGSKCYKHFSDLSNFIVAASKGQHLQAVASNWLGAG